MELEIKNAVIEGTHLGIEDHGIFTFYLNLDYGDSSHQGAGGYSLGGGRHEGSAFGCSLIMEVLKIVGVDRWEDLKGKNVRVKASHMGVQAVGNFLKDDWLDFKEFAAKYKDKEGAAK